MAVSLNKATVVGLASLGSVLGIANVDIFRPVFLSSVPSLSQLYQASDNE